MSARNIESIFRLTSLQEGLLFHTLEAPERGAYFDQFCATVNTDLDIKAFEQVWTDVVKQHAALRTFFTWEKREHPLQVVRTEGSIPFEYRDLTSKPEAVQTSEIEQYLEHDRALGFVLDQAPLSRLRVFRLEEKKIRFVWSFHHLILDGWSVRLILDEVQKRYSALMADEVFLPVGAPTFEAFVEYQKKRPKADSVDYWRTYLKGFTAPTTPRISGSSLSSTKDVARQTSLVLSHDLNQRLIQFAQKSQVTLNTLFVAAWGLVLSRYCDEMDVVFGATSSGRPPAFEGLEHTAGLFITTLPVRLDLNEYSKVVDLLRKLQQEQTEQQNHQHIGLNEVQKMSDVPAGMPLFETLLVFENFPSFGSAEQASFSLEDEHFSEYSHYPLALLVVPDEEMQLIAVYQLDAFSESVVNELLECINSALEQIVSCEFVADIDVLPADMQGRLRDLSRGADVSIECSSVVTRFERCVAAKPDSVAIVVGSERFSFSQIDNMSSRLASVFSTGDYQGSRAGVIFCERGHWPIIAQLAALRSGVVYATLDVKDPHSRIDYVLNDLKDGIDSGSQVPILITTSDQSENLHGLQNAHRLLLIDKIDFSVDSLSDDTSVTGEEIDPTQTAYVIYTSGSTGQPKGVVVSHGSLANSTLARNHFYPESPTAFALLSSLATDSSIAGVFWSLATGATLVMPRERAELDVEALAQLFRQEQVSHTLCVPSLYALMLDAFEQSLPEELKVVIVAGEACSLSLVKRHANLAPSVDLYNEYGPSEACVWVTAARLSGNDSFVSIGTPIANTRALVLDSKQRPVPIGVTGELYVGGANLATGYLGHNLGSDSAFAVLNDYDQQRFYRTGDKVILKHDGQLEYVGRVDNQLKVRGFRVEPGEIESLICLHEQVQSAIVLVDDGDIDQVLDEVVLESSEASAAVLRESIEVIERMSEQEVMQALALLSGQSGESNE